MLVFKNCFQIIFLYIIHIIEIFLQYSENRANSYAHLSSFIMYHGIVLGHNLVYLTLLNVIFFFLKDRLIKILKLLKQFTC